MRSVRPSPAPPSLPAEETARRRAVSDYLAVSRGADLYDTPEAYLVAEARAWATLSETTGIRADQ